VCVPWLAILYVVQRWRTDTCLPFSCKLYDVVTGKEPRLWNCPKSSCHGAFPDTRNLLEPSHVKNSPFLRGTRGVVLLSSWVWKDVNGWALEIGISCTYSNPVVTGGQKHTHTHTHTHVIGKWSALVMPTSSPHSTYPPRPATSPSSCIESTCSSSNIC
jgi:hypothetical protein